MQTDPNAAPAPLSDPGPRAPLTEPGPGRPSTELVRERGGSRLDLGKAASPSAAPAPVSPAAVSPAAVSPAAVSPAAVSPAVVSPTARPLELAAGMRIQVGPRRGVVECVRGGWERPYEVRISWEGEKYPQYLVFPALEVDYRQGRLKILAVETAAS